MENNEYECSFKELSEWFLVDNNADPKKKCGHYTNCSLPIKGYGSKVWAVVAHIETDLDEHRASGASDEEIVQGCINFLNKPLTRRHRKPRYGNLSLDKFKILEDKKVISVCLLIDQINNKNFWGKGWRTK